VFAVQLHHIGVGDDFLHPLALLTRRLGKIPETGADIVGAVLDHQTGFFDLPPQGIEAPSLNS
jgi:hypothetical protein